ncbi:FecR family protein [Parapedobacter koreensis]|nr:FecR family protein [Parapedobacter koreensis]
MKGEEQRDNPDRYSADKRKNLLRALLDENRGLADRLLPEDEWETFQQTDRLPAVQRQRIDEAVKQGLAEHRGRVFQLYLPGLYAIAGMLLVVGCLSLFWKVQSHRWAVREQQRLATIETLTPFWKTVSNDTVAVMRVVLADHSVVSLHRGSNIRFREPLDAHRRDIQLQGKARFDVARDTTRPFTVLVNGFATTALGTSFTIDASGHSRVEVWLHSGKVKLWHTDKHYKEQYLSMPGAKGAFEPKRGITMPAASKPKQRDPGQPFIERNGTVLSIHNMALDNVMARLAKEYGARIDCDQQTLSKVSYTGTINIQQERLEQVLQVICALNHLKLERTDEQHYRIVNQ